ncbi:MAG: hypothetical protein A2857_00755 [Candidatus Levybacteria bacterium RIFCSPHIGHO2_01_FULL_36_15]|nr:MAG: hypothetical protein A2857_00755 [Candidatus Levybacteria bacterium RIFCSPHIGHO2_01_FULL_36_15]
MWERLRADIDRKLRSDREKEEALKLQQRLDQQKRLKEEAEERIRLARSKETYVQRMPAVAEGISQELTAISSSVGGETLREINQVVFKGKGKLDKGARIVTHYSSYLKEGIGQDADGRGYTCKVRDDTHYALNGVFLKTPLGIDLFSGFVSYPITLESAPSPIPSINGIESEGLQRSSFLEYCNRKRLSRTYKTKPYNDVDYWVDRTDWTRYKQSDDFRCSIAPYGKFCAIVGWWKLEDIAHEVMSGNGNAIHINYKPLEEFYNLDSALARYRRLSRDQEFLTRARRMVNENLEHDLRGLLEH